MNWKSVELEKDIELAQGSGTFNAADTSQAIRLSPRLENSCRFEVCLPDLIDDIREDASHSEEFYGGILEDRWLKTSIHFKNPDSTLSSDFTIHSNVLPCEAYWARLRVVVGQGSRGGRYRHFFNYRILEDARAEGKTLKEKMNEYRDIDQLECELSRQLRERVDHREAGQELAQPVFLDPIHRDNLTISDSGAKTGGEGTVQKVLWRQGTFAMKAYNFEETFDTEFGIASMVSHPHIVHTFGSSFDDEGNHFLLMELMNEDLYSFVRERTRVSAHDPPFILVDSLNVLLQLAQAMNYLHDKNVVQGDLKSANVLISRFEISGESKHYLVKVADFGSAKVVTSSFKPSEGTHLYAAPEVLDCRGTEKELEQPNGHKIDVYSFGIVAYEVLTGLQPYHMIFKLHHREPYKNIRNGVKDGTLRPSLDDDCKRPNFRYPEPLIDLVKRCWHPLPQRRPSFSEICRELNDIKNFGVLNQMVNMRTPSIEMHIVDSIEDINTNESIAPTHASGPQVMNVNGEKMTPPWWTTGYTVWRKIHGILRKSRARRVQIE